MTEKDEQYRLTLVKVASEGLYHQLCQPISLKIFLVKIHAKFTFKFNAKYGMASIDYK